jgi:rhodanese-related sulfurtransferase
MTRLPLLALLAALAATPATAEAPATPAVATIAPQALEQRLGDPGIVVLDVRTPEEYAAGHVPGAVNVPHDQVESRLAELAGAKHKEVVLYCRSGRRAQMAADVLAKAGFRRLSHLEGDYTAWSAAGRPSETPGPAASPTEP